MHIILGATGHIGSVLTDILLKKGEAVTAVTRHPEKAERWRNTSIRIAQADVQDTPALHRIFKSGKRLYLLNPPAPPNTDTAAEELKTITSIFKALEGSGIEKVVGESTYGAQPGEAIGDLGVLYHMEQELAASGIPHSIIRGAYYMSNWDASLETARKEGIVHTLYPVDFVLPMVAPADLAKVAARLMLEPVEQTGLHYVEGPAQYSTTDVAAAFATALRRPVKAVETPQDQWVPTLENAGFSRKAAVSMAAMTELTKKGPQRPDSPERGSTTLQQYIHRLVQPTL